MFCPKCGAENANDSIFCARCGNQLQTTANAPPPTSSSSMPGSAYRSSTPPPMTYGRSPIIAAVLNLFWGIGYLYLGYKKVLGIQTIIFVVLMIIVYFLIGYFTFGIISFLIAILLAVDGYQKAQGQKGFIGAEM